MRAIFAIASFFAALHAPDAIAQTIAYGGGDGASFATAIVVQGAKSEIVGVAAERIYVERAHPDWRQENSALIKKDGRAFDTNTYRAANGSEHTLIFDITSFFGKL
jgi:hypothetical protein